MIKRKLKQGLRYKHEVIQEQKSRTEINKIKVKNRYKTERSSDRLTDMKEALEQKPGEDLEREIIELKRQLAEANEMIRKLSEQIEELQRAGKRQAAPFAR